jgi:hypothetical protein
MITCGSMSNIYQIHSVAGTYYCKKVSDNKREWGVRGNDVVL